MEPIKKLPVEVVNRIAAGEIIQRPANALKELIENSIDAKATNIQITVKNGGLKLLQIQDNGTGIRKEDFEIVCERFTTSKLREFEDLQKIATYGFRGEALASISHIAHLTITSKTENQLCAYQGTYVDSKLQQAPKPAAGNQGTIITVEDLFYNMHVRRTSLRSPAEEYQKITDVINKYAIHNANIGFALKKSNEANDIRTPQNSTQVENIKIIYGNGLAKELIEFSMENEQFQFKVKSYISNVNYSPKKFQFLLFINHRLVECQSLKKAIDQVYATYLPKHAHPFVYMSLELNPSNIDVNVHPTKHEVHFLNEEQIVDCIATELEKTLLGSNSSRTFYIQTKLPQVLEIHAPDHKDSDTSTTKKVYPHNLVRTDAKEQKIDKFFDFAQNKSCTEAKRKRNDESLTEEEYQKMNESFLNRADNLEHEIKRNINKPDVDKSKGKNERKQEGMNADESDVEEGKDNNEQKPEDVLIANVGLSDKINQNNSIAEEADTPRIGAPLSKSFIKKITRHETKLTSVLELRKEIEGNCHRVLREIFAQHVYVGAVDPAQALIQYSTKLYLCNTRTILEELFYQLILFNFQNFDKYTFSNKIPVYELAMICFEMPECGWTPEDGDKSELARRVKCMLTQKAAMMLDYFSLEIDEEGNVCAIPILLENYFPDPKGLPMYICRLATEVNWNQEKECFRTFAKETAKYYCSVPKEVNQNNKDWKCVTQHVLYPAIKEYFIPPKKMFNNGSVLDIADLHKLYKVFERC